MTTVVLGRTQTEVAYPEIPNLPTNTIGFCPLKRYTPNGWPPGMPKRVQKAIAEAVPAFGMTIRVYYPERKTGPCQYHEQPLWGHKGDPLVIGERDGKLYLIAAWE